MQSRRDDLARWLRARCSRHAGSRHWNTHVHESDRRRRARPHDQRRQRADRQFETRECKSIRWIDNCSVVVAVSERRGDQSTHVDGGACRALLGNPKPEEVVFADGKVSAKGQTLSWQQAVAALPAAGITSHGEWRSDLQARGVHGVCFAEVEVDVETGFVKPIKMVHIQDGGLPLNRLTMESQINGGMIQSLGMALWEGRVMDAQLGMQLNPGFGDYKLPGSLEMPEMVPIIDDDDKREAVIGIAEGCIIPAVGALANAVFNATGVRVRELPITPDKILMGLMKTTVLSRG